MSLSLSPPLKRAKLEYTSEPPVADEDVVPADFAKEQEDLESEVDDDHCSICLQAFVDRTVIPSCSHEFCFECILVWSGE